MVKPPSVLTLFIRNQLISPEPVNVLEDIEPVKVSEPEISEKVELQGLYKNSPVVATVIVLAAVLRST